MPYTHTLQPYQPGSDTSHEAAQGAFTFAETQRGQAYEYIAQRGDSGATMAEVEMACGIKRQSVCARFGELRAVHAIEKVEGVRRGGCQAWRIRK